MFLPVLLVIHQTLWQRKCMTSRTRVTVTLLCVQKGLLELFVRLLKTSCLDLSTKSHTRCSTSDQCSVTSVHKLAVCVNSTKSVLKHWVQIHLLWMLKLSQWQLICSKRWVWQTWRLRSTLWVTRNHVKTTVMPWLTSWSHTLMSCLLTHKRVWRRTHCVSWIQRMKRIKQLLLMRHQSWITWRKMLKHTGKRCKPTLKQWESITKLMPTLSVVWTTTTTRFSRLWHNQLR